MGLIKYLRAKYFGRIEFKKHDKAVLEFEGESIVPRSMRRKCKKNLPFGHKLKKRIKVLSKKST